jgi:hypothetical protein
MILTVVLCACEIWSNKLKEERRTSVFGNMMLRIFGPGQEGGENCIIKSSVTCGRSQSLLGRSNQAEGNDREYSVNGEKINACQILVGKLEEKSLF